MGSKAKLRGKREKELKEINFEGSCLPNAKNSIFEGTPLSSLSLL
jgi:hypothetical protein